MKLNAAQVVKAVSQLEVEALPENHPLTPKLNQVFGDVMTLPTEGRGAMKKRFNVGDHVIWNSEAGWVSGKIVKVHTEDLDYKGYTHHASKDDPQYEIKSDKTDHVALHKGAALQRA